MNATDATISLKAMAAATVAPVLTDADIARLIVLGQVTDASGVLPGGTGYVPTYTYQSLKRPAVAGLREKLARVMTEFDVGGGPGVSFARSQKIAGIQSVIRQYQGGVGVIELVTASTVA